MMATTHALAGVLIALLVAPESSAVLLAGFVGGLLPDLDLYAGHRRTLHFPTYYGVSAAAAGLLAFARPTTLALGTAVFLAAAAAHSMLDVFGGGLELRPWEGTSDRAVYNHALGRWHRPRRWIRYDGAPEDALLGLALAAPALLVVEEPLAVLVGATVAISVGYSAVRRYVPAFAVAAVGFVPDSARPYVPERFTR